jgi:hypothetical protein
VAHAARFDGGSTTGSCSAARGTFRAVQRITQSLGSSGQPAQW